MTKSALVLGAGGFIGNHLVNYLKELGYYVTGVDLVHPSYNESVADSFILGDLRQQIFVEEIFSKVYEEVYQLAADMGGASYIFSGKNDADIITNSSSININVLNSIKKFGRGKVFYSSSACVYPVYNQKNATRPNCSEESVYPAKPDSDYGWEKLFSERLYLAYKRNYGLDIKIARLHNIFGPIVVWNNGKEKAPAAICRKVAQAKEGDIIEIWGPGTQTRSFLFIDECLKGIRRLMDSIEAGPLNIGSEEMITINDLARQIIKISEKNLKIKNIEGPVGVMHRNSDNRLIREKLNWEPKSKLNDGLKITYDWISKEVTKEQNDYHKNDIFCKHQLVQ